MHLVMQCLPFAGSPSDGNKKQMYAWIAEELEKLKKAGRLDETMYELVRIPMIVISSHPRLESGWYRRISGKNCGRKRRLCLVSRRERSGIADSRELVLVQGIVDAFFYEDGDIILMDYKTDSVEKPEQLIQRYQAQLDLYARALEEATGKKVREKIIYSFHLKKEIILP